MNKILFLLAITLFIEVFALYGLKEHVEELEYTIKKIDTSIKESQNSIEVLEAEWSFLTKPARLKQLAHKHLKMHYIFAHQVKKEVDQSYTMMAHKNSK